MLMRSVDNNEGCGDVNLISMNCIVDATGRSGKWQQALAWLVNMGYLDIGLGAYGGSSDQNRFWGVGELNYV